VLTERHAWLPLPPGEAILLLHDRLVDAELGCLRGQVHRVVGAVLRRLEALACVHVHLLL